MTTDNSTYKQLFHSLIQHKESEVVEFKKAENNFDFDDLGKYFSALSNEANLRGLPFAWLVFGYDEKKHEIVGTSYKDGEGALNKLKHDFTNHTTDGQTFREIIPVEVDDKLRSMILTKWRLPKRARCSRRCIVGFPLPKSMLGRMKSFSVSADLWLMAS